MQTTLRIDDALYREAKAAAAREGITLTRFLEDALRLRLQRQRPRKTAAELPAYHSGIPHPANFDLVQAIHVAETHSDSSAADRLLPRKKADGETS